MYSNNRREASFGEELSANFLHWFEEVKQMVSKCPKMHSYTFSSCLFFQTHFPCKFQYFVADPSSMVFQSTQYGLLRILASLVSPVEWWLDDQQAESKNNCHMSSISIYKKILSVLVQRLGKIFSMQHDYEIIACAQNAENCQITRIEYSRVTWWF